MLASLDVKLLQVQVSNDDKSMYNIGSGIVYNDILGFIPVEVLPSSSVVVVIKLLTE